MIYNNDKVLLCLYGEKIRNSNFYEFSFREIGFEDGKPIFRSNPHEIEENFSKILNNPKNLEKEVKELYRQKIKLLEYELNKVKKAMDRNIIYSEDIFPFEKEKTIEDIKEEAKIIKNFESNIIFSPPNDIENGEGSKMPGDILIDSDLHEAMTNVMKKTS